MPPSASPVRALTRPAVLALLGVVLTVVLAVGAYTLVRNAMSALNIGGSSSRVTHSLVVQRIQAVAKLVTSEATVRDVVVAENTRFWSTKRALLVVTGRVLAGINLDSTATRPGAQVHIDDRAHRITISLPSADILGVEVLNVRTYDEQAGLLNPFTPADRDSIQAEVRAQLRHAGEEMGLVQQANRSATLLLQNLFAQDGYSVDVVVRGAPATGPIRASTSAPPG